MRRAIGSLLLSTLLLAAGCGPADQYYGGVRRSKQYRSIVSLSPSTTEVLSATQEVNAGRLTGKTAADNYPKVGYDKVPVVSSVKPDYEKIAEIRPDLVVYDTDLYNAADVAKIKAIGADTFPLDATTIDQFETQLYSLANLVGGETNISDYVDKIEAARAVGSSMTTHPKVVILLPGTGSEHMIDGTGSFQADVVRAAGGDPVGPSGAHFVPLDPELLVTLNPDFIITAGDPAPVLSDPRFQSLKAVKDKKRIVPLVADVLLRKGARVDVLITAINDAINK
jgi:ABC-type Fe3+-hydroxamate transport system substrate-binding protein